MGSGPTPQKKLAIMQRREQVASLYVTGLTQAAIALTVGVSQRCISKDLVAIRKAWLESTVRDFDSLKAEQLAKLDRVEREAWDAWRRSQRNAVQVKVKKPDGAAAGEREKTVKGQVGDPRFLEVVADCVRQRREIFGLDAPKRQDIALVSAPLLDLVREMDGGNGGSRDEGVAVIDTAVVDADGLQPDG